MKTNFTFRIGLVFLFSLLTSTLDLKSQFVPGQGGVIQFTRFVPEPGRFAGLYVGVSDRRNRHLGGGTISNVTIWFPTAAQLGADSLTLQIQNAENQWINFQHNGVDLSTTLSNFALSTLTSPANLRLIARGGRINGYTSNVVRVVPSAINTYFQSWGLDESPTIAPVMAPWVGRGLRAGFTVKRLADNTLVSGGLTYQWHRVNPVTFAKTSIQGADSLTYITTNDDVGHILMIVATGDGTNVGGQASIMSSFGIEHPNNAFVNQVSPTGFRLNLYRRIENILVEELELTDREGNIVPITSVTRLENGAMYDVVAVLSPERSPYFLRDNSPFWGIGNELFPGKFMEGIGFTLLPLSINLPDLQESRIFPVPANRVLNFVSDEIVLQYEIFNLQGLRLKFNQENRSSGYINISSLPDGMYLIRLTSNNYVESHWFKVLNNH